MHELDLSFHVEHFIKTKKIKKKSCISQKILPFSKKKKYQRISEQLFYIDLLTNSEMFRTSMITSPSL